MMKYKIFFKILIFALIGALSYFYISNQSQIDKYINSLSTSGLDLYIANTTDGGLTLHWRTTVADNSEIEVSADQQFNEIIKKSITSREYTYNKSIRIDDLKDETIYYFRISNLSKTFDHRQFNVNSVYPVLLHQNYLAITIPSNFNQYEISDLPQPFIVNTSEFASTNDYTIILTNRFEPQLGAISINNQKKLNILDISRLVSYGSTNQIQYDIYVDSQEPKRGIIMLDSTDLSLEKRVLTVDFPKIENNASLNLMPLSYATRKPTELKLDICCITPLSQTDKFIGRSVSTKDECKASAGQLETEIFQSLQTCNQTFNGVCCKSGENVFWSPEYNCSPGDTLDEYSYEKCISLTPTISEHTLKFLDSGINKLALTFVPTASLGDFQKIEVLTLYEILDDKADYICANSSISQNWNCATKYNGQIIGSTKTVNREDNLVVFVTTPFDVSVTGY